MGFNFVDPKAPFDVSGYKGISFWAKRGENSASAVRVKLPDVNTDPEGKVCTECFNDFGMDIELTTTWTQYVVLFGAARQQAGWGQPRPGGPESAKMYGVQWQVNTPGAEYDIYIDDVQFTGCP
jgi:endoglucanase